MGTALPPPCEQGGAAHRLGPGRGGAHLIGDELLLQVWVHTGAGSVLLDDAFHPLLLQAVCHIIEGVLVRERRQCLHSTNRAPRSGEWPSLAARPGPVPPCRHSHLVDERDGKDLQFRVSSTLLLQDRDEV